MPHEYKAITEAIASLGNRISPEMLIDCARDPKSPLHHLFAWDNREAGHSYRLVQARRILREYRVVYRAPSGQESLERGFVNVHIIRDRVDGAEEAPRWYVALDEVMSDPELREDAIGKLWRRVCGYRHDMELYPEFFGPMLRAMDRMERMMAKV